MKRILSAVAILLFMTALLTGCNETVTSHESKAEAADPAYSITAYLDDDMIRDDALAMQEALLAVDHVTDVLFVDKDEALEAYRDQLGDEVLDSMTGEDNPLPYSYKIAVDAEATSDDDLFNEVIEELKQVKLERDGEVIGGVQQVAGRR